MDRYRNVILNDREETQMKNSDLSLTLAYGVCAIVIPWQLVNMLNLKRDPGLYGPMLKRSTMISMLVSMSVFAVINHRNHLISQNN